MIAFTKVRFLTGILIAVGFACGLFVTQWQTTEEIKNYYTSEKAFLLQEFQNIEEEWHHHTQVGVIPKVLRAVRWIQFPEAPTYKKPQRDGAEDGSSPEPHEEGIWSWLTIYNSRVQKELMKVELELQTILKSAEQYFKQCEEWNDAVEKLPFGSGSVYVMPLKENNYYTAYTSYYQSLGYRKLSLVPENAQNHINLDAFEESVYWDAYLNFTNWYAIGILITILVINWFTGRSRPSEKTQSHEETGNNLPAEEELLKLLDALKMLDNIQQVETDDTEDTVSLQQMEEKLESVQAMLESVTEMNIGDCVTDEEISENEEE